jgi:DMSO/TMAO reductase YedYZ molybdopterin-dependent catalytic subunit
LTSNDLFFVRNHFAVPQFALPSWKLRVSGRVRFPLEITYDDILRKPSRTLKVTLECAGNGVGSGGVSTATWTGVPFRTILAQAGMNSGVRQVRFVGADQGEENSANPSVNFARSIPLQKALHPDTLLAYRMNGAPLPPEHGYPLRAIIPGWYGMDCVKWLTGIEVLDHADRTYFMTERYIATRLDAVGSDQRPLTRVLVKSLITKPREGEILKVGLNSVEGAAWAGERGVAGVEVSTSGGKNWTAATLNWQSQPYSWVFWTYSWEIGAPGVYTVMARATDDEGNVQPSSRDPLRIDSYELNSYHSVRCEAR